MGYEGTALADFIKTLEHAGVTLLLDVRQLPQSRRPGFSKRVLSEAVAAVGIVYRHVRQLGDPKPGRDAARRGDMEAFRTIFGAHLELEETQAAIAEAADDVKREIVALMCFERAPAGCHRALVAQRIQGLTSSEIVHLGVSPMLAAGGTNYAGASRRIT